jgi:hypothetical protein
MPVQSTPPAPVVTRPEILASSRTPTCTSGRGKRNSITPQGETNNLTSYEGAGGIQVGGILRRSLIALERGDIAKLPFSDDVKADSRLLMRRNVRERAEALAPFLTFDPDPYIIIGDDASRLLVDDGRVHDVGELPCTRVTTGSPGRR